MIFPRANKSNNRHRSPHSAGSRRSWYNDTVSLLCVAIRATRIAQSIYKQRFLLLFAAHNLYRHCERCISTNDGAVALRPYRATRAHVFTAVFGLFFSNLISAGGLNLRQLMFFILFNVVGDAIAAVTYTHTHFVCAQPHNFNCFYFLFSFRVEMCECVDHHRHPKRTRNEVKNRSSKSPHLPSLLSLCFLECLPASACINTSTAFTFILPLSNWVLHWIFTDLFVSFGPPSLALLRTQRTLTHCARCCFRLFYINFIVSKFLNNRGLRTPES